MGKQHAPVCIALLLASMVPAMASKFLPPGVGSAIARDVLKSGEVVINVHPPTETLDDVRRAVDEIEKLEAAKRLDADEDFAAEKQLMVNRETQTIDELVTEAFKEFHD